MILLTLEIVVPESFKINQLQIILIIFQGKETNFEWMDISFRSGNDVVQQKGTPFLEF